MQVKQGDRIYHLNNQELGTVIDITEKSFVVQFDRGWKKRYFTNSQNNRCDRILEVVSSKERSICEVD